MARARVKPEDKKQSGAPITLNEAAYDKMADELIKWVENAPVGAVFGDFICDTPYTRNQVEYAEKNCESFARKLALAKAKLAQKWRILGVEKNSSFISRLLPLVDKEYKEWRMQELKMQAIVNADPKAALNEIMNQSQSPIKE